eukprot:jgi/Psemu1/309369/fgenesh1_kg.504_\
MGRRHSESSRVESNRIPSFLSYKTRSDEMTKGVGLVPKTRPERDATQRNGHCRCPHPHIMANLKTYAASPNRSRASTNPANSSDDHKIAVRVLARLM